MLSWWHSGGMSEIDVAMLWVCRKGCDIPELLNAWDGYSIEENFDGWAKSCKDALDACGGDVDAFRYVNIKVDADALDVIFRDYQTIAATGLTVIDDPASI